MVISTWVEIIKVYVNSCSVSLLFDQICYFRCQLVWWSPSVKTGTQKVSMGKPWVFLKWGFTSWIPFFVAKPTAPKFIRHKVRHNCLHLYVVNVLFYLVKVELFIKSVNWSISGPVGIKSNSCDLIANFCNI